MTSINKGKSAKIKTAKVKPAKAKSVRVKSVKLKPPKTTPKMKTTAAPSGVPVATLKEPLKSRIRVGEKEFIARLTEKLTHFHATMILEAAMLSAGVERQDGHFKKDETREICLALIKRGGPAYSVGANIYREVVG